MRGAELMLRGVIATLPAARRRSMRERFRAACVSPLSEMCLEPRLRPWKAQQSALPPPELADSAEDAGGEGSISLRRVVPIDRPVVPQDQYQNQHKRLELKPQLEPVEMKCP